MSIGFIGAGRAGKSLGLYFKNHGLAVAGYYSRSSSSAEEAASLTKSAAYHAMQSLICDCDLLFITTPDDAIVEIAQKAAQLLRGSAVGEKSFLHVSGVHTASCLDALADMGCPVGSMHPLQSLSDPLIGAKRLETTFFGIDGTPKAQVAIKNILAITGGRYGNISPEYRALYHAGACIVSNYLVTLIQSGLRYFEAAGMDKEMLFSAAEPLIAGTIENFRRTGAQHALTGPIARGDAETIALHLKALQNNLPSELSLYRALALETIEMVKHNKPQQAEQIKSVLKGSNSHA